MAEQELVRCTYMRGGTSKAVFFKWNELPSDPEMRDKVLLAVFGSPDIRQIDGMGGSNVTTSKAAIIAPSSRPDADVDYLFAQVQINTASVKYDLNCGNISAAVGPYAIDEGMVKVTEPYTTVRIHNINTGKILIATVEVRDGKAAVDGDFAIDGVPGTAAKIDLDFKNTTGAITGKVLPTGNPVDIIHVEGIGDIATSTVDMTNCISYVLAKDLGATGTESPPEIEANKELMQKLEAVRSALAVKLGFIQPGENAALLSPIQPGICMVAPPTDYVDYGSGEIVKKEGMDLVARSMFNQAPAPAFGGSATFNLVVASLIEGTLVNQVRAVPAREDGNTYFGHPRGVSKVNCKVHKDENGEIIVENAVYPRTARRIFDGHVYIKKSRVYEGKL